VKFEKSDSEDNLKLKDFIIKVANKKKEQNDFKQKNEDIMDDEKNGKIEI